MTKEVAVHGIRVNTIAPGLIGGTAFQTTFTPIEARNAAVSQIPLDREGTPEDVAGTVVFLLSDLSSYGSAKILLPTFVGKIPMV